MLNVKRFPLNNIKATEFRLLIIWIFLVLNCLFALLLIEIPLIYIYSLITSIFIVAFSIELSRSTIFVIFYYFLLIVSYFLVGYFGVYSFNRIPNLSIFYSRIFIGLLHFLPLFIIIGLFIRSRKFRRILFYQYFIVVIFVFYVLFINCLNHDINMEFAIEVRNFFQLFAAFLWGGYVSNKINFKCFSKGIILIAIILIFFGIFEYFLRYDFWLNYFPCYFVALIKKSGFFENGLIGNKITGFGNKVLFRMSSFFYEPKFAGYNFVFYFFFLIALVKARLVKFTPKIFGLLLLLILLLCIVLTFIKSAWGIFVLSIIILIFSKLLRINKLKKFKAIGILLFLFLGFLGSIGLIFLFLKLGITSTTMAHVKATLQIFQFSPKELLFGKQYYNFDILNSDSGLATIVFSIGFVGYFMFICGIVQILKNILKEESICFVRLIFFSLIIAWFAVLHFKSDVWSPLGNFILFFTAGLVSNLKIGNYYGAIYNYPHRNRS